jgi:hypothetical protein
LEVTNYYNFVIFFEEIVEASGGEGRGFMDCTGLASAINFSNFRHFFFRKVHFFRRILLSCAVIGEFFFSHFKSMIYDDKSIFKNSREGRTAAVWRDPAMVRPVRVLAAGRRADGGEPGA